MPTRARFSLPTLAAAMVLLAGCATPSGPVSTSADPSTPGSASSTPDATTPTPASSTSSARSLLKDHAVSAAHPAAVKAGMDTLEAGGNAADAAVATAFAVAVVEPFASGIGGGGSAVIGGPGTGPVAYDYREVVAQDGVIPESGTGIPGFVSGLAKIHAEHGQLPWGDILRPAIELAEDGFPISDFLAHRMDSDAGPGVLRDQPQFNKWGGIARRGAGDQLVQQDLANTMKTLATEGPQAFYTGSLVRDLSRVEGLDAKSLGAYRPERLKPVSGAFGDYEVVSVAPALPGAALIQMLQVAEGLDADAHRPGSAGYVDRISRSWATADASVTRVFGDHRYVDVPVDRLTDAATNAKLARDAPRAAGPEGGPSAAAQPIKAGNTTHLTVVDSDGLTISMTNTITNFWGGGKTESVGGFFLNNQLSRFASLDTPNNQPAPGRKSVSWAAPTLVLDQKGRVVLGLGSPGGHQIPNILTGVLVPWALQDMSLQAAIEAPRQHLQDGVIALEENPDPKLKELLHSRGWKHEVPSRNDAVFGSVQALQIDYASGRITGATDPRREAAFKVAQP